MLRILPLLCAFVLLAASGIGHRLWTGAWTMSNEPAASAARVAQVPATLGDWVGADQQINARELTIAGATGYLARRYVQRRTNAEVSLFLICGRPGPIAVHTPDICYSGLGFQLAGAEGQYKVEGADMPASEFVKSDFHKPGAVTPERLRIYWAWKSGPGWKAPSNPRLAFGAAPALYKLYVVYRAAPGAELPEHDPAEEFMHDLLPELEKDLSPAP